MNCVYQPRFYGVFLNPFKQSCVTLSHAVLACERLSLLRMLLSHPVLMLSPVISEPAHLWNVPNRCFNNFLSLLSPLSQLVVEMCYWLQIQNNYIFTKLDEVDQYIVFVLFSIKYTSERISTSAKKFSPVCVCLLSGLIMGT